MTREHNWADNYTFSAGRIHRPASVDEVRRLVAGSPRIRAIGARHSFNGVADSPGDLIDLRDIDPGLVIDPEPRTVTVGAAPNYGVLAARLPLLGWAPLVDQDAAGRRLPGRDAGSAPRDHPRRPAIAQSNARGDAAPQPVWRLGPLVGAAAAFPARGRAGSRRAPAKRVHGPAHAG